MIARYNLGMLPTMQEIVLLHKKYAPTAEVLSLVFTHCQIVSDVAAQLMRARGIAADGDLVKVGALLHDIGVYPLFGKKGEERKDLHYITHGIRGEKILREEGFPEVIWRFASHHTGVGLTKLDIESQNLPLPAQNYEADTVEEQLVMYADKFHSKTSPSYFNSYEWYKKYAAKFGQSKVAKFEQMAQEFGVPNLVPLIEKYGHPERP